MLSALNQRFLNVLFPRRCLGCGKDGAWVCEECGKKLRPHLLEREVGGVSVLSYFDFEIPLVREALHALKYDGIQDMATILVDRLPICLLPRNSVLIPVPVSRNRLKSRGYNQAHELAKAIGSKMGLPVWSDALRREGRAGSQVGRGGDDRRQRTLGFQWLGDLPEKYAGRHWVVVDDLVTTGTTLAECFSRLMPQAPCGLSALTLATKR